MLSLFSTDPGTAGFRLHYMEVLNWGTFNNRVYRINPQGNNSLLTGANGAGKTSYVHALLTLLVPEKRMRSYGHFSDQNQKKNTRTEESYVVGEYGEVHEEGRLSTTAQQIRPDKTNAFSILLASFRNREDQGVTIFQARWFVQGELKRVYGISFKDLTVEHDFLPFDASGDWKKILAKRYNQSARKFVEFFDGPGKYADRLINVLGMKSENALGLFNQIVGIKVLGDLDEFIRNNMLEYQDTEEEFISLKNNFQTLLDAKINIDKAKLQLEMLKPIVDKSKQLKTLREEQMKLQDFEDISKFWFADKKQVLLTDEIDKENLNLQILELELRTAERESEELKERERTITLALESSSSWKQLKAIEEQIKKVTEQKTDREDRLKSYNSLASKLKFPINPDKRQFLESMASISKRLNELRVDIRDFDDRIFTLKKETESLSVAIEEASSDLAFLRGRSNNIIGRVAQIREDILDHVRGSREEIPFIGELIQVNESEADWESAIERLLHGFALRLIVPENYYRQVNDYIHSNRLNGKIVYAKYSKQTYLNDFNIVPSDALYRKLDFDKRSPYYQYVENEILTKYNYICTTDLYEFEELRKAMLISGLSKSTDRHQKDDRAVSLDKRNYVLGWDNARKTKILETELRTLGNQKNDATKALNEIIGQKERCLTMSHDLVAFQQFTKFDDVDCASSILQLKGLYDEKEKLEKSSDEHDILKKQFQEVKSLLSAKEKEVKGDRGSGIEGLIPRISRKEDLIQTLRGDLYTVGETLKLKETLDVDFESRYRAFEEHFRHAIEVVIFVNVKQVEERVSTLNDTRKREVGDGIEKLDRQLERLIRDFKNPIDEIREQFRDWKADVMDLSDKTANVFQYEDLFERLERDDLPSYQKQFSDYLSNTMKDKVAIFRENLNAWDQVIEENIELLNEALKRISFNTYPKETYIQLRFKKNGDGRIKDLLNLMEAAVPDVTRWALDKELEYRKAHFEKIALFIHTLDKDQNWRAFTTDVRNWKIFFAEEYSRETDKAFKTYMDMGKLSGGEKAQLTYTILGSAIAYQFGLTSPGLEPNSFRFIAVDESFSNQDDQKSNYLLNLCEQLHLQLLAVTPSDKIHIVEPKISFVHFVQRKENGESVLYDMPILKFQQERAKWLAKEAAV